MCRAGRGMLWPNLPNTLKADRSEEWDGPMGIERDVQCLSTGRGQSLVIPRGGRVEIFAA